MYRGEMSNGISARIQWYTMWYSNITIYVYIPCIARIREPKHDLSWFYTYVMYVSPYSLYSLARFCCYTLLLLWNWWQLWNWKKLWNMLLLANVNWMCLLCLFKLYHVCMYVLNFYTYYEFYSITESFLHYNKLLHVM